MWKNILESGRPEITIGSMRIGCWIPKAAHTHTHTHTHSLSLSLSLSLSHSLTHSQCAVLIAFPLQQCLYERASLLRYTYIACLV
jgi:hypothetical protein